LKRHCERKHLNDKQLYGFDGGNLNQNGGNLNQSVGNLNQNGGNLNQNGGNLNQFKNTPFQCDRCDKYLANKRTLRKHIDICTGVKNSLECYCCHKLFNTYSAKSKHLKKCTSQTLTIHSREDTLSSVSTINTSTINNGTINTGNINSNNTINNNIIITFKQENGDMIEFITKHITNPELKEIIAPIQNGEKCSPEMVETFTRHLLTNPENRCIEKTNMRSIHSKVHVGDNTWQTKHDKDVLPYYACSIANNMDQTIKERLENDKRLIDNHTLKTIEKYLDYMSVKGYCNDADLEKEIRQEFYEITHRLKAAIYDTTID
jgi:hypothetical protein